MTRAQDTRQNYEAVSRAEVADLLRPDSAIAAAASVAHTCQAKRCPVEVPPSMFMCQPHWFIVPPALREAIKGSYRPGQETDNSPPRSTSRSPERRSTRSTTRSPGPPTDGPLRAHHANPCNSPCSTSLTHPERPAVAPRPTRSRVPVRGRELGPRAEVNCQRMLARRRYPVRSSINDSIRRRYSSLTCCSDSTATTTSGATSRAPAASATLSAAPLRAV